MKTKIRYICPKLDLHHKRIISALEIEYEVNVACTEDEKSDIRVLENKIVYSPLSAEIGEFSYNPNAIFIGISMAFDLNHEIDDINLRERILSNINIADSVIVDCEFSRSLLIDIGFTKRIEVIPFGCNQEIWNPKYNRNYSTPNFISTRSWTDIHNNQLLVEAIFKSPLLQQYQFSLFDPGIETLLSLEKKFGVDSLRNVVFHEFMDETTLKSYSDNFAFFVSTSISDGSSVSLLEALSAGLICVVPDFPSNCEWIEDRVNGFLFENNCVDSLIYVLESLLTLGSKQLEEISNSGSDSVKLRANWDDNSQKVISVIRGG